MNEYATLGDLKGRLGIEDTASDALLLTLLDVASRTIETHCGRRFFSEKATRIFDGRDTDEIGIDDCLSITTLKADSEGDGTLDGETWTQNTDFVLRPNNTWPKRSLYVLPYGNYSLRAERRYLSIAGVWGYGDGTASPWLACGVSLTIDATATTATIGATLGIGNTLKVGDEYMAILASNGSGAYTVQRGINGSAVVAHSGIAVSVAQYPAIIVQAALILAAMSHQEIGRAGIGYEMIGDYQYRLLSEDERMKGISRLLWPFVSGAII